MANFLSEDKKQVILALLRLKHSQREIQRRTGVKRSTISKYGKLAGILPGPPSKWAGKVPPGSWSSSRSLAAPYQEEIEQSLVQGLTAQRIYQDLREKGFIGKYWSIKRFVKKLKKQKPEVCARIEVPAGKEAQVDLGKGAPAFDPSTGKYKRPYLFRMVLSHSRHSYEEVMWRQNTESFIRAHENAFRFFGGVPEIVILDNLKAGIIHACFYDPTINPVYQSFAKHYGFEVLPCKVRKPEHKGKVENSIDYVQDNALKGRKFDGGLEAENIFLQDWNCSIASLRIHGTTKEQVIKRFKEKEQPALKGLPIEPFKLFKIGKRRVHTDGHVEVEGAYYSVPCEYLGQDVTIHCDAKIIRLYSQQGKEVAVHVRQLKGCFRTLENHLPEHKRWSQLRLENQLKERAAQLGRDVLAWADKVFEERGVLALRVLQGAISLSRQYTPEQINLACGQALKHESFRYRTIKLLCEKQRVEPAKLKQEDEIIRPLLEYAV
jgi:transposase